MQSGGGPSATLQIRGEAEKATDGERGRKERERES